MRHCCSLSTRFTCRNPWPTCTHHHRTAVHLLYPIPYASIYMQYILLPQATCFSLLTPVTVTIWSQCIPTKLFLYVSCIYHIMFVFTLCTSTMWGTEAFTRLTGVSSEEEKNTVQEIMAFLEKYMIIYFAGQSLQQPQTYIQNKFIQQIHVYENAHSV